MRAINLDIEDLVLFEPDIYSDDRGYFYENFSKIDFYKNTDIEIEFVQENQSYSKKNVLRGLHYQIPPFDQGKLIKVMDGVIFDVAVDIRRNSKTFLKWVGIELSSNNHKQLWIPPGFAHGFLALSDTACISYKTTQFYSPKHEKSIIWNDDTIGIKWPITSDINLSEKDSIAPKIKNIEITNF